MSYATFAGFRVSSARVSFPWRGVWVADIVLPVAPVVVATSNLVIGPMTLRCTPERQADYGGERSMRLIGGAGGWRKRVSALGYSNPSGVALATILGDVVRETGETIEGATAGATVGRHYARGAGAASRVLDSLVEDWHVRPDGVTDLRARSSARIVTPFSVISRNGSSESLVVATEHPEDWMPGRTFSSFTTPDTMTIGFSRMSCAEDGKLRIEVLYL